MARADELRDLRARWSGVDPAEVAQLVERLVAGAPISDGPSGTSSTGWICAGAR